MKSFVMKFVGGFWGQDNWEVVQPLNTQIHHPSNNLGTLIGLEQVLKGRFAP